jgi:hypothetical protein
MEGLLGRLEQTVLQEALGNSGTPLCPRSTGVELLGHREGEGGCDDVWEGEGGGVSSFAVSGRGLFIGRREGERAVYQGGSNFGRRPVEVEGMVMELGRRRLQSTEEGFQASERGL